MKKKKLGKMRYVFIFIGVLFLIFAGVVGYLVVKDLEQEDILKQEIVNLSNMDLLTDNYDIKVKTKGDYAYIEEAVKTYYKTLSDNIKIINSYLNDEDLIQILSADNLKNDRPKFVNSHKILSDTREKSNAAMKMIIDLCSEDAIKDLIDKDKVDKYSYELYLELMYTEDDLEEFAIIRNEMQIISDNLNTFLDKVEKMIKLLEENADYWFIEDGQLYFEKDSLVTQYNNLYNDLNNFASEKFSNYNQNNNTNDTNANV